MKIAISGSSGLIGSNLCKFYKDNNDDIYKLVRIKTNEQTHVYWNYNSDEIEIDKLEGSEVIVHLAGENIAGLWTKNKKQNIRNSRIDGTRFLARSVSKLNNKPKSFICASAIGIYGSRGDEYLDEQSGSGSGFLAQLAEDWEDAANVLNEQGIRVVNLRMGLVLSKKGGAFEKMLTPFKLGLGGRIGNGKQYVSWVVLDDLISAVNFIIQNDNITGPVNIVSPNPVSNGDFTKILGKSLNRPTFFRLPSKLLKTFIPEMAEEMLLASTRVIPKKLTENGFEFQYTELSEAFDYLLK